MYARSTTITGDASRVDRLIGFVQDEVVPAMRATDGNVGLSLLVDRDSGRCIATSSWQSEETRDASREAMADLRSRAADLMAGTIQLDDWEVAIMHRAHMVGEGSCCRVSWIEGDPGRLDEALDYVREMLLPRLEGFDGFCSYSMLVDRANARTCGTVVFDSREAMDASRDQAMAMRETAIRELGARVTDVAEFDVAYAHLRVPELV